MTAPSAPARLQPQPTVGAPGSWRFPVIAEHRLSNGIRLLAVHLPGKQVATVQALVDLPVDADPAGLEGLAVMAARCLDVGTASYDEGSFAEALERRGASFDAGAGYDGVTATLQVPVSRLAAVLPLLVEAVTVPTFPTVEVERVLKVRLAQITQERSLPPSRASQEFAALLHTAGTRPHLPAAGTATSIAALTPALVGDAYRARARPATTTLVVAGDLSGVDVPVLFENAFGSWAGAGETWAPRLPTYGPGPSVVVVDRPGSVQTQLVLGHASPPRSTPEWPAMLLAAYVMGGTLTSRIDAVLREEKGYTYGTRASFASGRRTGSFTVSGSVDTVSTGPALTDLQRILATAVDGGLTRTEVDAARDYLVGVSPMRWETPGAVAGQLTMTVGNDLPLSWTDGYLDGMRQATLADVDAALRAHVRPSELLVVAVGEASAIVGPLTDLGLGTPRVVEL